MKRLFAILLSVCMLLSVTPLATAATTPDDNATVAYSGSVYRAAFTTDNVRINGRLTESSWAMSGIVGNAGVFAAQWNLDNLYIGYYTENKEPFSMKLNGIEITESNATAKAATDKKSGELSVKLATLGAANTYGERIRAEISLGSSVWKGEIVLSSIEWITADNPIFVVSRKGFAQSGLRIVDTASEPTANQGFESITGGHRFYDRYSATGPNPPAIFTSLSFFGETYEKIADRTVPTLLEFDFYASAMPVYKLGDMPDHWAYRRSSGFVWEVHDTGEDAQRSGYSFSIVNTEAGLVLSAFNEEDACISILGKKVGDKFRISLLMNPDDSVTLYVDGEERDTFRNMRFENTYFLNTGLLFGLIRNQYPAESDKDNFEIDFTNVALGKYYGESAVDILDFTMFRRDPNKNMDPYSITGKLALPAVIEHPHFAKPVKITWESSDPSVIDPATGNVTRPAANGKLVTLKATSADGASKEFELYVKGLAPTSKVLTVANDNTMYKGKGVVTDVHEYIFDRNNNSLVLDLGEKKTVNVIVLKDSDEVTRLNESMLMLWVSDDNELYTEGGSFKMLRAGQYTYLYDFEMTGRYVKVHCTSHYAADSDFIGPLDGMIDAYFEEVFGSNGSAFATESTVTLTNDTDTATFDTVYAISPADAGVNCLKEDKSDVRFYLDGELLYHYFNGSDFEVRVTKVPKSGTATLRVLSGNADAMDISNKEYTYEVVYGTRETYPTGYGARFILNLPNGLDYTFYNTSAYDDGQLAYKISTDNGRSWFGSYNALGSYGFLIRPAGIIYDEAAKRIIVSGMVGVQESQGVDYFMNFMYSDDTGRTWKKAEFVNLVDGGKMPQHMYSYSDIIQTSVYDGEDGPNVDFVTVMSYYSPAMMEYYGHGYPVYAARAAYTSDGGKTWYLSDNEVRYYDGEGVHRREMGLCELAVLEAPNGDIVMYMRCQFDNLTKLAYAKSSDHGKTWTDAEISDVYGPNLQPEMWDDAGHKFMLWAGNTLYGQNSFRRYPLNMTMFTDDELRVISGTQDIFSRTSAQGLSFSDERDVVNPKIGFFDGDLFVSWGLRSVRINDYLDYFFRTKGAYDSFEGTTAKYEGWMNDGGELGVTDAVSTDGEKSMYIKPASAAVRSIPQVENGTIGFDLYLEDVEKTSLEFELEAGFSRIYGEGAPIAFKLNGNQATFLDSSTPVTLSIKDGWNHFELDLALANETPSASLSVNGSAAVQVPVNAALGAYVTFVSFTSMDTVGCYLDAFHVVDLDDAYVPDVIVSAEAAALTEVPESLADEYADVSALTSAMQQMILTDAGESFTAENTTVYALSPIISRDGGDTWNEATADDVPDRGMTVKIDYPIGTSSAKHNFIAMTSDGKSLTVTEKDDALYLQTDSLSPVIVAWEAAPTTDASPLLWIGVGIGIVAVALLVVAVTIKPKKKEN